MESIMCEVTMHPNSKIHVKKYLSLQRVNKIHGFKKGVILKFLSLRKIVLRHSNGNDYVFLKNKHDIDIIMKDGTRLPGVISYRKGKYRNVLLLHPNIVEFLVKYKDRINKI